jgi:hypothetical protein
MTKTRLTQKLLEETDIDEKHRLVCVAQKMFPTDVSSLLMEWNLKTHKFYPQPVRDKIFCVLCCHASFDARHTLGKLPDVLLYHIFEFMTHPSELQVVHDTCCTFQEHDVKLWDLCKFSTEYILNRLLSMELHAQNCVYSYANFVNVVQEPPPIACFDKFISDKCSFNITHEISEIRCASFTEGAKGFQIIVNFTPIEAEEPKTRSFWKHDRTGKVIWVDDTTMYFSDGYKKRDEIYPEALRLKGFYSSSIYEWRISCRRMYNIAEKRCKRMQKQYFIATENAMNCWNNSTHRVLRVQPMELLPRGLIGLLVFAIS